MRTLIRILPAAVVLIPALLFAEDRSTLDAILARARERFVTPDAAPKTPEALLGALAGADPLPAGCATPIVAALTSPSDPSAAALRPAALPLLTPPDLAGEHLLSSRDGRFTIHYPDAGGFALRPADLDRNSVPDMIDRLSESLAAARSFLQTRFGAPLLADGPPLDVYVTSLGHGIEGYSTASTDSNAATVGLFLVLAADLPADRILAAATHQLAHALLLSHPARAPIWWAEATASWLTFEATGEAGDAALRARQQAAGRGLASDDLLLMQGDFLWPLFLAETGGGPGVVRQVWDEMATRRLDPLAAADQVLRRGAARSAAEALREYAVWNLFTGERDDGRHYASGRAFPPATLLPVGPSLPFEVDPVEPIEPFGSAALRLPGDGRNGSVELEVRAEGGRPAADLLIFLRGAEAPALVPVPIGPGGGGQVSLPWSGVAEAWIVLRNEAAAGPPARFALRGSHDPYAPFDLASLVAGPLGGSIALEWTTASEKGLVGWNVYRSASPVGPFLRLNAVAIPAYGDGSADTGYVFVDDTTRPGRRYYYRLEGFTDLGLAERSQVVSGRIDPVR